MVMANGPAYDFGEAFARLTCLLEDMLEPVSEGQGLGLDRDAHLRLAEEIEQGLDKARVTLKEIKAALER